MNRRLIVSIGILLALGSMAAAQAWRPFGFGFGAGGGTITAPMNCGTGVIDFSSGCAPMLGGV